MTKKGQSNDDKNEIWNDPKAQIYLATYETDEDDNHEKTCYEKSRWKKNQKRKQHS